MARLQEAPGLAWEGSYFVYHSLALINRELAIALIDSGNYDVGLIPYEPSEFGPEADRRFDKLVSHMGRMPENVAFHVRHRWPPSWEPTLGKYILIQPWEFGSIPAAWVPEIKSKVSEVWVPSSYVRQMYIDAGVRSERVAVVPNGVNPKLFYPGGPASKLDTTKHFKFLFVGGTIPRKGFDALLAAYGREFSAKDDVCLVIKDMGTKTFYRGQGMLAQLEDLKRRPGAPEILYLDADAPEASMGDLYRACDCLVHPYRGEGFGLPIAEAMACGLPVVVTNHGACLDFCSPETAYLIDARVEPLRGQRIGDIPTIGQPFWAQPSVEHLQALMRQVYESQDEARGVGARASQKILQNFTWADAARCAMSRLDALNAEEPSAARRVHQEESPKSNASRTADAERLYRNLLNSSWNGSAAARDKALSFVAGCQRVLTIGEGDPDLERQDLAQTHDAIIVDRCLERLEGAGALQLLYDCARSLTVDGRLVIITAEYSDEPASQAAFWTDPIHVRPYTKGAVVGLCSALGLEVTRADSIGNLDAKYLVIAAEKSSQRRLPVMWVGDAYSANGYGDEARNMILSLDSKRFAVRAIPSIPFARAATGFLDTESVGRLRELEKTEVQPREAVAVIHLPPTAGVRPDLAKHVVVRTMSETDRLPDSWVEYLNQPQIEEVWVPAEFNVETFAYAGVDRRKLHVVPGGVSTRVFNPEAIPLNTGVSKQFKFLSIFDWHSRKGWDILLRAYIDEFDASDDVALLIRASHDRYHGARSVRQQLLDFVDKELGRDLSEIPEIVLVEDTVPAELLPGLYRACDAFVLPTRGEGWGRPFMEAMACGLPVIGTRWSGHLKFMNDSNSYLIDIEGLAEIGAESELIHGWLGHKWAIPSYSHLRELMRRVWTDREAARAVGNRAAIDIAEHWDWQKIAGTIEEALVRVSNRSKG